MKKLSVLAVLILACVFANAQNTTIKGKIIDKKTSEAVMFANVMNVSDTSKKATLINGTTTNDNGEFILQVKKPNVVLKFSSLGYAEAIKTIKVSDYPKTNNTIDIGTITLETNSENLEEVSIIAKQTRIEMNNDKIVLNIDDGLTATSANAFEMLRKVPGVVIDKDENITLNGKSGILFQLNGRDIRVPYDVIKSILKGMSPNDIAKIETITNPSAKYEAEGTAGIINIIMSQEKADGISGSLSSWNGVNEDFRSFNNMSLSYVDKKWTITAGGGFGAMNGRVSTETDQYIWTPFGDTIRFQSEKADSKNKFRYYNFDFSADYNINDKNTIGAMFVYNGNNSPDFWQDPQRMFISKNPYTTIDSSYSILNKSYYRSNDYMGSLYFTHKTDTLGGEISASFDINSNSSLNESTSKTNYFNGNFNDLKRQEDLFNDANNEYSSYAFSFDVNKPFGEKMNLEFGVKSRLAIVDNDFKAYKNDNLDSERTNQLKYKENVNAGYVSFSHRPNDKFSWRAGLRFEHTYTSIDQKATNDKITDNYFDLFPNLNVSYRVGKMDNVSLTYSYRISRPDYNSLNPFRVKLSDYNYSSGNPDLMPEYTHKLDLNYAFHYMLFFTASYSYSDNEINQVMLTTPNSIVITQKPMNTGYSQQASIGLSTMLPLGPVEWTIWMQGVYSQMKSDNALLRTNIERFAFTTWQSLTIDFFWKTQLSFSGFYMSGGVQMGGEFDDMFMLSASLSKDFLNKALKISIGVDQLPKRDFNAYTHYNNYKGSMSVCWQRPQFTFNISYNIGKGGANNQSKRRNNDMDDRKSGKSSIGQGGGSPMGM